MKKNDNNGTQVCNLNDLLFDVELIKNPFPSNPEYSKVVMGKLPIDGETQDFFLNACSDRYELVKNADIFPKIEDILNSYNIAFKVKYQHTNHVRFYAEYSFENEDLAYELEGTNDKIYPMLKVQHSYNGLTKYNITFGYFRLVCSNGLTIPVKEMNQFNLSITGKHTKVILASLEELEYKLNYFAENVDKITGQITENYETLKNNEVLDIEKRINDVLKASGIKAIENNNNNTIETIKNTITAEANDPTLGYNGKANDWLIYNGINAYIYDSNRSIAAPEKRANDDSNVLEFMLDAA